MHEIYHFLLVIDNIYTHIFYKDRDLGVTPEPLEWCWPDYPNVIVAALWTETIRESEGLI